MLRPVIHRRDRINAAGLSRSQRLEKLQHGLIIFGLVDDVVDMFRDRHIGAEDLGPFLRRESRFAQNSLSMVAPSLLRPGQFSGV